MFSNATRHEGPGGAGADKEPPSRWGKGKERELQKRVQQCGKDSWRTDRRKNSQENKKLCGKENEQQCGQDSGGEEGRKKAKTEWREAEDQETQSGAGGDHF